MDKNLAVKPYDLLTALDLCVDFLLPLGQTVPEFGQKEKLIPDYSLELGGSAVIVASQVARLGGHVAGVGAVGTDVFGQYVLNEVARLGLPTAHIRQDEALKTGVGVALCKPDGDRAILTYPGSLDAVTDTDFTDALLTHARHLHIGSYFLMTRLQPHYPAILQRAKAQGMTVSLDTNWDPAENWQSGLQTLLPFVDILLPNEAEALGISGQTTLPHALAWLGERVPVVALKRGADGADLYVNGQTYHAPALPTAFVDAVGAGDSFDGGLIWGFLNGYDWPNCLRIATACGSLSTRQPGGTAGQPTWAELWTIVPNIGQPNQQLTRDYFRL